MVRRSSKGARRPGERDIRLSLDNTGSRRNGVSDCADMHVRFHEKRRTAIKRLKAVPGACRLWFTEVFDVIAENLQPKQLYL